MLFLLAGIGIFIDCGSFRYRTDGATLFIIAHIFPKWSLRQMLVVCLKRFELQTMRSAGTDSGPRCFSSGCFLARNVAILLDEKPDICQRNTALGIDRANGRRTSRKQKGNHLTRSICATRTVQRRSR